MQVVEQGAARHRVIGDLLPTQAVDQVIVSHQERAGLLPDLGLVLAQPEQLGQHVEGGSALSGDGEQFLGGIALQNFGALVQGATIQPVDGIPQRLTFLIEQDKGYPLGADRDALHRAAVDVCISQGFLDRLAGEIPPGVGILLDHRWRECDEPVLQVALAPALAALIVHGGFATGSAQVYSNQVRHGSIFLKVGLPQAGWLRRSGSRLGMYLQASTRASA